MGKIIKYVLFFTSSRIRLFVIGLFLAETVLVIIMRKKNDKVKGTAFAFVGVVAFIFSFFFWFSTDVSMFPNIETSYQKQYYSRIVAYRENNDDFKNRGESFRIVFFPVYLEGKTIELPEEEKNALVLFSDYIKDINVNTAPVQTLSKMEFSRIIEDNYYCEIDGNYFVLDEYWYQTDDIVLFRCGRERVFLSKEIGDVIKNGNVWNGTREQGEKNIPLLYIDKMVNVNENQVMHEILLSMVIYMIGSLFTLIFWGERFPLLSFAAAFPIGVAVITLAGLILIAFRLPYNLWTLILFVFVICLLFVHWKIEKIHDLKSICWKTYFGASVIFLVCCAVSAFSGFFILYGDSLVKMECGAMLAHMEKLQGALFYETTTYGMLEPIVLSVGFLCKITPYFSLYHLMYICSIFLLVCGGYYIYKKDKSLYILFVLVPALLVLLANGDFLTSATTVLSHVIVAVYILMIFVFAILHKESIIEDTEMAIVLSMVMILITRVEGTLYVMMFLLLLMGYDIQRWNMKLVNLSVSSCIILWNVLQFFNAVDRSEESYFWTPGKAILLCIMAVVCIAMTYLWNTEFSVIVKIRKNLFFYFFVLAAAGSIVVSVWKRRMVLTNLIVWYIHFTCNETTNAGAFWLFVFMMVLFLLAYNKASGKLTMCAIIGYLVLVYAIMLFRKELPIRPTFPDSGRRMLIHIMPTAIWLLTYSIGGILKGSFEEARY